MYSPFYRSQYPPGYMMNMPPTGPMHVPQHFQQMHQEYMPHVTSMGPPPSAYMGSNPEDRSVPPPHQPQLYQDPALSQFDPAPFREHPSTELP